MNTKVIVFIRGVFHILYQLLCYVFTIFYQLLTGVHLNWSGCMHVCVEGEGVIINVSSGCTNPHSQTIFSHATFSAIFFSLKPKKPSRFKPSSDPEMLGSCKTEEYSRTTSS